MKVGLLWFDNNAKRDLTEKIIRAAKRYRQKFGIPPDTCYVHKSALSDLSAVAQAGNDKTARVGQIQVMTSQLVLPHYLWIGQQEQP